MEHLSTFTWQIQPRDYDIFVGMDVDKRSIVLTQLDQAGTEKSLSMPYDSQQLLAYIRRHLPHRRVAFVYEAGPTGFGLHDDLAAAGYPCLVVTPSMVPTARGKRVRTNRLDSRKLAFSLRGGALHGIRVPREEYRGLRELVQLRKMHMTEAARCKQRIKALFLRYSLAFPGKTSGGYWSQQVIAQVRDYPCAPALQFKLRSLLTTLEVARMQAAQAQAEMRRFVAASPELSASVRYASSIPGVGWLIATYAIARIGDWTQLGTSDQTASFFGLVQREDSTGDTAKRGSITKAGDSILRSMLVEGAWTAIRNDPELKAFYQRVYATHPRDKAARIAIVAVARKLANRLHCVLKERREYRINPALKEEQRDRNRN